MHTLHYALLIAAFVCAIFAALQLSTPRLNLIALALALFFASFICTGCTTVASHKRAPLPPETAPIAVVGSNFVNDAVEVLEDYKDFKSGNTGWLYTLEKGLHAYGSVTKSVADAKVALKPFVESKGQPFLDRILLLLKKKPEIPLATKMAAVATLADSVAGDKGP